MNKQIILRNFGRGYRCMVCGAQWEGGPGLHEDCEGKGADPVANLTWLADAFRCERTVSGTAMAVVVDQILALLAK